MPKTKLTWFRKDLETMAAALELWEQCNKDALKDQECPDPKLVNEQEIVRCIDLSEHIDWLLDQEVQPLIQIDLSVQ